MYIDEWNAQAKEKIKNERKKNREASSWEANFLHQIQRKMKFKLTFRLILDYYVK